MGLTRDQIRERLKYAQLSLTTSRQNVFSSDVAERAKRNIVAILIMTDATLRYVEIEKQKEDDTWEMIFDNVPIDVATGPFGLVQLPNNYDIENPIIVLEGGTNLSFIASAGAPEVTVIYWDDEL
jgi:hypothetical protein